MLLTLNHKSNAVVNIESCCKFFILEILQCFNMLSYFHQATIHYFIKLINCCE